MAARRRRRSPSRRAETAKPRGGPKAEQKLSDETIQHAVRVERVKSAQARDVRKPWEDATDDIVEAVTARIEGLRSSGALFSEDIVSIVQREVTAHVAEIVSAASTASSVVISETMVRLARIEATWAAQVMTPVLPVGASLRMPPLNQIRGFAESARWRKFGPEKQARPLTNWMQGIEKKTKAEVRDVVAEALRTGESVPATTKRLRDVMDVPKREAEAVARTAFNHASSAGMQMVADENTDVVIGVLWVSTLDSRVTPTCAALDGTIWRNDEGPRPPAHFNCRSRLTLLTRSPADIVAGKTGKPTDEELQAALERRQGGTRAAIDYQTKEATQVSAKETYGQWLRRQPATVQDDVLGATRARLFRSGQVQIDQFVGADYQLLPLRELESRYGIAI